LLQPDIDFGKPASLTPAGVLQFLKQLRARSNILPLSHKLWLLSSSDFRIGLMMAFFRYLMCFGLLAGSYALAEDWRDFRGPQGNGHTSAKNLPTVWSETQNVRWKTDLPGEGFSTPVISEGRLWMTTAVNNGKSFRVLCVDQATGKLIHDQELFTVEKPAEKHKTNSYASPSCVLEPGRVYVHFGTYGTA
jgi:hypothetical protein